MTFGGAVLLRRIAIISVFVQAFLAGSAMAGTSDVGAIYKVMPHYGGLFFNSTGVVASKPACATLDQGTRWVINTATPQGQAMVAALLSAYSLKKRITVYGTGTCDVWGDTETVANFVIED